MLYLLIQMLFLTGITGHDNKCTCTNVNERGNYNRFFKFYFDFLILFFIQ